MHPAEYKFAAVLNQFHHLTCSYQVDLQVVASKVRAGREREGSGGVGAQFEAVDCEM